METSKRRATSRIRDSRLGPARRDLKTGIFRVKIFAPLSVLYDLQLDGFDERNLLLQRQEVAVLLRLRGFCFFFAVLKGKHMQKTSQNIFPFLIFKFRNTLLKQKIYQPLIVAAPQCPPRPPSPALDPPPPGSAPESPTRSFPTCKGQYLPDQVRVKSREEIVKVKIRKRARTKCEMFLGAGKKRRTSLPPLLPLPAGPTETTGASVPTRQRE